MGLSVYNKSDKGQAAHLLRSEWEKEQRQETCGAFVLPNGERNATRTFVEVDGHRIGRIGKSLGSRLDYFTNVSGAYVFYSGQDTEQGLNTESTRFLTDGQRYFGE
jgi:hypothetical protein